MPLFWTYSRSENSPLKHWGSMWNYSGCARCTYDFPTIFCLNRLSPGDPTKSVLDQRDRHHLGDTALESQLARVRVVTFAKKMKESFNTSLAGCYFVRLLGLLRSSFDYLSVQYVTFSSKFYPALQPNSKAARFRGFGSVPVFRADKKRHTTPRPRDWNPAGTAVVNLGFNQAIAWT